MIFENFVGVRISILSELEGLNNVNVYSEQSAYKKFQYLNVYFVLPAKMKLIIF